MSSWRAQLRIRMSRWSTGELACLLIFANQRQLVHLLIEAKIWNSRCAWATDLRSDCNCSGMMVGFNGRW